MVGKRTFQRPNTPRGHIDELSNGNGDLESGKSSGKSDRRFPRFKDAVNLAMDQRTQGVLKKQIIAGVDKECFEEFRIDEDELKEMKNKKVRNFYKVSLESL